MRFAGDQFRPGRQAYVYAGGARGEDAARLCAVSLAVSFAPVPLAPVKRSGDDEESGSRVSVA